MWHFRMAHLSSPRGTPCTSVVLVKRTVTPEEQAGEEAYLFGRDFLGDPKIGLQSRPVPTRMLGLPPRPGLSVGEESLCHCPHLPLQAHSPPCPLSSVPRRPTPTDHHGSGFLPLCAPPCWKPVAPQGRTEGGRSGVECFVSLSSGTGLRAKPR